MNILKVQMSSTDMIITHLIQRLIYQYHSLFSEYKSHPSMEDLTRAWYLKVFLENPYFNNLQNTFLVNYEILENKNLLIVLRAPLFYQSYLVSLEKDIYSCVTYTDNEGIKEDINIFTIKYEL
jgi:hypothetical protein